MVDPVNSLATAVAQSGDLLLLRKEATDDASATRRPRSARQEGEASPLERNRQKDEGELSWSEALDMLLGSSPRKVWRTLNYCIPALLLVSLGFMYLARDDSQLLWLFSGFIALTLAFAVALNWTLLQVLPPEKDDAEASEASDQGHEKEY
ncbi:hypothetical protein BESB_072360 [Besnoitia besnoiti]|uniref:Transmembrane protein n=1 Tax=Besnoitia besnoiti TaxID=94643 RepID=A0A2A9MA58_BESBE|nr:uncharacterized protein BESB_072360 [Besnoitia besnoiti]PFH34084.1 hypothetical protein BESB_072360 [Besnoitia besnoiti]